MARAIGPDDVEVGMYVTPLSVVHECVAWWRLMDCVRSEPEVVRWVSRAQRSGVPLKVLAVDVPFVLVEDPKGKAWTLDMRKYRLAAVSRKYGKEARRHAQVRQRPACK